MPTYLDLERRFGLQTRYSVEELLVIDAMGRERLEWRHILAGRYSLVTARANFGKTMELKACAQRLREEGLHSVFVPLHRLLEVGCCRFRRHRLKLLKLPRTVSD